MRKLLPLMVSAWGLFLLNGCEKRGHEYIGLTLEEAEVRAEQNNDQIRIVEVDGKHRIVTMDRVCERVNLVINSSVITAVRLECEE